MVQPLTIPMNAASLLNRNYIRLSDHSNDNDSYELSKHDDKGRSEEAKPKDTSRTATKEMRCNASTKLANPLIGITHAELEEMGEDFARKHRIGDEEDIRAFRKGACLAQDPKNYHQISGLTTAEMDVLTKEFENRWSQPALMYIVIIACSLSAAVQGMDETVVNGAQLFYRHQFGIDGEDSRSSWLTGLLNSAPYLCCAFIGCWLTTPLNHFFGRRGTIFLTCAISALACLWQGFVNSWWHMFIARFVLGIGIGPKSATVPIYAAETTPPAIRGALVMQWQMWTAFGIMLGYVSDLIFYNVPDASGITGLNWRIMMVSAMLPALIVVCFIFMCPESPRWYMSKGRHSEAYDSMRRLRFTRVQAARDVFYMHVFLEVEKGIKHTHRSPILELIKVPRNRRAMIASEIVMFMQQVSFPDDIDAQGSLLTSFLFCGINVIAYYSSQIFLDAKLSPIAALSASLGFGIVNWLFAIPAVYTIDTFGRRNLLLTTFPLMALCLFFTGFSFYIPEKTMHTARIVCIAIGIYLFGAVYSPGEGPVPYTYSAEAYPLYVRTYGMSLATATTWFFNFVLSITWPSLEKAFGTPGAFAWYATWNIIGFFLVLFLLPETKGKTLEELDQVFSVPTRVHAAYGLRQISYFLKRYLLRQYCEPAKLYENDDARKDKDIIFNLDTEAETASK